MRARASWRPPTLGSLRYGSELMGITADATLPGALGSFRWDDEGVGAQAIPLVREGVLRGFLSSRESAAEIGLVPLGRLHARRGLRPPADRADDQREPRRRATRARLDELIGSTAARDLHRDQPLVVDRLHAACTSSSPGEAAWEIVDGRLGRMLRDPVYAGTSRPCFWGGLDAVCSPAEWRLASVTNCGKGEPGQFARRCPTAARPPGFATCRWARGERAGAPGTLAERRSGGRRRRRRARHGHPRAIAAAALRALAPDAGHRRSTTSPWRWPRCATATWAAPPPTASSRTRCGVAPAAAARAAESAARTAGAGDYPGFPRAGGRARPTTGTTPRPRASTRAGEARRWRAAFDVGRRAGTEASGLWTAGGGGDGRSPRPRGARVVDRVTDAFLKVVAFAPGGRSGYAVADGRRAAATSTPRAVAERAAAARRRRRRRAERAAARASTPW